jgi:hypothetical protein
VHVESLGGMRIGVLATEPEPVVVNHQDLQVRAS